MAANDIARMIRAFVEMVEKEADPVHKLRAGQLALQFMELKKPRKSRSDKGITEEDREKVDKIRDLLG